MKPRTSRKDYKNHQYSGSRKSRKRVQGQMKRYHGEVKSRNEVWCKRPKLDDDGKKDDAQANISSSFILNNIVKTYSTKSKKFNVEASYTQNEQLEKTENETTAAKPLDINWPLIDPTVNSHELTVEYVSPDNLAGLSGNRIVDLAHVLQWAFRLERHRSECKGSSLARNNQDMNAAAKDRKNFPLYIDSNGSLQINKKHNYYYQIQGQLRVSQMKKCYFVGYISPAHDITVLEIERDEHFILDMLPKLVSFYKNSVLPEVVSTSKSKK